MESSSWNESLSEQIGAAIDLWRGEHSDQWITDRCRDLGNPISRTAVSEYRRGIRKTMPVADLLVLAAALEVPPVMLLFPGLPDGNVTALPGRQSTAIDAVRWFVGDTVFLSRDYREATDTGDDTPARELLAMSRELAALIDRVRIMQVRRVKLRAAGEDTGDLTFSIEDLQAQIEKLSKEIGVLDGQIRKGRV